MSVKEMMFRLGIRYRDMAVCPSCTKKKLFKGENQELNALDRRDNKTLICSDCGDLQGLLDKNLQGLPDRKGKD